MENTTRFAIKFVLGYDTHTLVVQGADSDDAYYVARDWLRNNGLVSASLQGVCCSATATDLARSVEIRDGILCRQA